MKCRECEKENKTSRLTVSGPASATLLYFEPYYDEEGKYHNHDSNIITTGFSCSNGHEYTVKYLMPCQSCNFGGEIK